MNDNYDITIVIPSIIVSIHLKKCIESINNISSSISIIVVLDLYSEEVPILKNKYNSLIFCIPKNILNISQKRNIAVKKSNTKYIAFIDSDAYPDKDWLKNSINILEQYKDILIVGGPNISPPDQNIENTIIGEVQKSFLISGKWNFQKRLSKSRYTENLYSCNMVMLRSTFIDNGGMNEMLNAGEDYDFCCKINENTKRIYFNNNSVVYHYDRNIHNFIIQKIVRGSTVIDQIRNNSSVLKKKYIDIYIIQLVPLYFLLFIFTSIFYLFISPGYTLINLILFIISALYVFMVIFSMNHIEKRNIIYSPIIFILIISGNILIGIGSFISLFNLKFIYKYYKNID